MIEENLRARPPSNGIGSVPTMFQLMAASVSSRDAGRMPARRNKKWPTSKALPMFGRTLRQP
jgi:hypothetical protein